MANASPSSASTTTTPSSAWSRLVQITRTASESSLARSTKISSNQPNSTSPSQTHPSSSVRPAKRRRLAESPQPRPATKSFAPLSPEPNGTRTMVPRRSTEQISCLPISEHDCITACPCRVEDVDCVASQQPKDETASDSPSISQHVPSNSDEFHNSAQRVSSSAGCQDDFESTKHTILTHSAEKHTTQTLVHGTGLSKGTSTSGPCDLSGLRTEITVEKVVSSTVNRSTTADLPVAAIGLQEGDQNTVNKTPRLKRDSSSSTSTDESIQLVTPSSSPTAKQDVKTDATQAEAPKPHKSAPAPKTKRRLTLHSGSYDKQTSHKKRKAPPKRKDGVQTTLSLSIGSSAGMRECKLCDTVYNPFHPEDVKVHAKRHAVVLKTERRAEEIAGLTESSLVE